MDASIVGMTKYQLQLYQLYQLVEGVEGVEGCAKYKKVSGYLYKEAK